MMKIAPFALALLALAGCRCNAPPPPEPEEPPTRSRLQALEQELLTATDDPESDFDAMLHEIQVVAKKLIWIEAGGDSHQAVDVYLCSELEKDHVCRFIYADDTIHTTEFPERYAPVVIEGDDQLRVRCQGACPTSLEFHHGDPSEMHSSGYQDISAIPVSDSGVLTLPDSSGQQILFTIVKQPGDNLYRKYVWVIEKH
jgi:hypothetical protein